MNRIMSIKPGPVYRIGTELKRLTVLHGAGVSIRTSEFCAFGGARSLVQQTLHVAGHQSLGSQHLFDVDVIVFVGVGGRLLRRGRGGGGLLRRPGRLVRGERRQHNADDCENDSWC